MYLTPAEAQKRYGYHPKTLTRWADEGKIQYIKSPGGHRRYLIESIEKLVDRVDQRPIILYARVSTTSQKDDLASQIEYLGKNYPSHPWVMSPNFLPQNLYPQQHVVV